MRENWGNSIELTMLYFQGNKIEFTRTHFNCSGIHNMT